MCAACCAAASRPLLCKGRITKMKRMFFYLEKGNGKHSELIIQYVTTSYKPTTFIV